MLEGRSLFDPLVVDQFGTTLRDLLHKRLKQEDRKPTLRMSNIGKPNRQLWYELHDTPKEKISGATLLKFAYGDLTEALVLALVETAGYKIEGFQQEVEVDGVRGHIDAIISGVLVDVKSCSSYSFQKFKTGSLLEEGQDAFGYLGQICGYAHALKLPAAWIAVDKTNGEVCVLTVPQSKIDEYDVSRRITEVRRAMESSDVPSRCYQEEPHQKSGNLKIPIGCQYCPFKSECWKDCNDGQGLRLFLYSDKPVWLSKVTKTPLVFEVTKKETM